MSRFRVAVLCQDVGDTTDLIRLLGGSATDVLSLSIGAVPTRTLFGRSAFDILILDSRVPDALTLCRRLRSQDKPRVIFVAAPNDDAWAIRALSAGARGIVYLTAPTVDVAKAVDVVRNGLVWAPRYLVAAALMQHLNAAPALKADIKTVFDERLSRREQEVFCQAALGLGNKELASRLAISQATVKVHLSHIFQKLGLRNRAELAAAYHGIFRPPVEPRRLLVVVPPDSFSRRARP
jgi:DNA-binding NarL/FixJ family response regulator